MYLDLHECVISLNSRMNDLWKDYNYELVWTADGSPSLSWADKELMHHRGGALSETDKIYGEVITETLVKGGLHFISVGLGLGYNELCIARECVKHNIFDVQILSFESDSFLVRQFLNFINGNKNEVHEKIFSLMNLNQTHLEFLKKLYENKSFRIEGSLSKNTTPDCKAHCILYDAFSSKTSPELWQEEFLNYFLQNFCEPNCLFSTYACTGALKRALKNHEFEVVIREGFHGKRNSTLGRRGFTSS
jgi:hypothetical protein